MLRAITMVVAIAAALILFRAPALAEPLKVVSQNPPVQLGYSTFVLHSDRIGRDFTVTVNIPLTFVFLPGQKLPVIYALDGGYGMAGAQGSLLSNSAAMEPAIIVSVGYQPWETRFRLTDLLHSKFTQDNVTIGGGGAAFEAFLLEDLKPFIEAKYPADPARSVLFGHSAGGLFAANVFADKPDAFYGYIIGSASVWTDPTVVARVAAAASKARGQRVYLTVGEKEDAVTPGGGSQMVDGYNGLLNALKGHAGLILKTKLYKGETHLSYYPRLVTDGFPVVLPPAMALGAFQAKLPAASMAKYVGDYRLSDGRKLTVTADKAGFLNGQVASAPPMGLQQNGPDRFYSAGADANFTFDAAGAVLTGVDGGTMRAERVRTP